MQLLHFWNACGLHFFHNFSKDGPCREIDAVVIVDVLVQAPGERRDISIVCERLRHIGFIFSRLDAYERLICQGLLVGSGSLQTD